MGGDNLNDFTLRQMPKYYSKKKISRLVFGINFLSV